MCLIDEAHASSEEANASSEEANALSKEAHASSLRLAPPDLRKSGSMFCRVYKWFIFSLFSVFYYVLSMFVGVFA